MAGLIDHAKSLQVRYTFTDSSGREQRVKIMLPADAPRDYSTRTLVGRILPTVPETSIKVSAGLDPEDCTSFLPTNAPNYRYQVNGEKLASEMTFAVPLVFDAVVEATEKASKANRARKAREAKDAPPTVALNRLEEAMSNNGNG